MPATNKLRQGTAQKINEQNRTDEDRKRDINKVTGIYGESVREIKREARK
jgi:hypothetical protein